MLAIFVGFLLYYKYPSLHNSSTDEGTHKDFTKEFGDKKLDTRVFACLGLGTQSKLALRNKFPEPGSPIFVPRLGDRELQAK